GQKVLQHLHRDRLRVGGHTFGDNTVVASKNSDPYLVELRLLAPLLGGQAHGQGFQQTKGAGRLGQLCLTGASGGFSGGIKGAARLLPPEQISHRGSPLSTIGNPATVKTTRWQRSASA